MAEPRTVVITGASRGLGFASAKHLYKQGWRVVAAMRSPDKGLPLLQEAVGARDDDRLIGIPLDLTDAVSISTAAAAIDAAVGAPDVLVHNAGISAAGMVEEASIDLWEKMFATHVFGPVALTKALLPAMRAAGAGRIVLVSSVNGVRGMPATAPYSSAKAALEGWGESLAGEVAPFGLGVSVLITGTYDTEIITDAGTTDNRDFEGPYARLHTTMDTRGRYAMKFARSPEIFARALAKAVDDCGPFCKHAVGPDAQMLLVFNRILPSAGMHQMIRVALGLPRHSALRGGAVPLTLSQQAMMRAATTLPAPVVQGLATLVMKFGPRPTQESHGE